MGDENIVCVCVPTMIMVVGIFQCGYLTLDSSLICNFEWLTFFFLICFVPKASFFWNKKKFFGENDDMLSVVNVLRLNFFSFIHFGGHFDQLMILLVLMMCSICMWWIDCRFSLPKIICSNKEKFNLIRFDSINNTPVIIIMLFFYYYYHYCTSLNQRKKFYFFFLLPIALTHTQRISILTFKFKYINNNDMFAIETFVASIPQTNLPRVHSQSRMIIQWQNMLQRISFTKKIQILWNVKNLISNHFNRSIDWSIFFFYFFNSFIHSFSRNEMIKMSSIRW